MLFSILIPAYNASAYIAECVRSVLEQSMDDYEIIIADDASSDDTLNLCKEFQRQYPARIKLIVHEKNQGLLLTRRDLFGAMQGDYAVCVDSDDWLMPGALEALKRAIEETQADLVLYELVCKHLDGREETFRCDLTDGHVYAGDEKQVIYRKLLTSYALNSMCTKAVKRNLIDTEQDYRAWSVLSNGEDLFQSFPIIDKAEKILYVSQAWYCYRKTVGSISTSVKPHLYDMWEILWEREDRYMQKWAVSGDIHQKKMISRINEIVLIMRSKKGAERKKFYERIRADGRLQQYLGEIPPKDLRTRYRMMCRAVLRKCDWITNGIIGLESVLLTIRK